VSLQLKSGNARGIVESWEGFEGIEPVIVIPGPGIHGSGNGLE
jgi:hypothetical protein